MGAKINGKVVQRTHEIRNVIPVGGEFLRLPGVGGVGSGFFGERDQSFTAGENGKVSP